METQGNPLDPQDGLDLARWVDGELEPRAAEAMQRQLADDPALRHEAERLRELDGLLEREPVRGRAPDVRAAVLARVERDLREDTGWRLLPRSWRAPAWAASWAACGILLGLIVLGAVEIHPAGESGTVLASAEEDLTLSSFLDDALEGSGTTVDSIAEWIEEPETEAAP